MQAAATACQLDAAWPKGQYRFALLEASQYQETLVAIEKAKLLVEQVDYVIEEIPLPWPAAERFEGS